MSTDRKLACVASRAPGAQEAARELGSRYPFVDVAEADVIVVLGGDGFLLHGLHEFLGAGVALFGMNRGTVGFLMNAYSVDGLCERIAAAREADLHPLRDRVVTSCHR